MKVKPIKIKIKEPTPSAADRLYAKHQAIRKAKGLPDPSEYKKKLDTMKKEEVEQLDELSPETKASYVSKAKEQIKQSIPYTKKGEEYRDIAKNFIAKRERGIAKVTESAADDPKADQITTDDNKFPKKSRKAQIVKSAAKKLPPEDQFQAKPVLDSQVAQQTNK